jgi:dTMP kinase
MIKNFTLPHQQDLARWSSTFTPAPSGKDSFFLSFEGIEGAGKSTQIQLFKQYLEAQGFSVYVYREPGSTTFGEELRQAILNHKGEGPLHPLAEAYLFASSRAQLLSEKVLPHLAQEKTIVMMDRYLDSSFIYQGLVRNLGLETLLKIHSFHPLNYWPHGTFLLELPLDVALDRMRKRAPHGRDYFEDQEQDFFEKLFYAYGSLKKIFPERIITIEANESIDKVQHNLQSSWSLIQNKRKKISP